MNYKVVPMGKHTKIKTGKLDANASSINGIYPFFTCSKTPLTINTYSYDCECVLLAGNGDLNVKYYSGKFDAYQRTYIIECIDNDVLDVKYLYYFLEKYVDKLREQSIGGVIKYIKLGYLTNAPLPSLEKQRNVVNLLDRAAALIEKRKVQIEKLDMLIKSRFIEMFGDPMINSKEWETHRISEIAETRLGKMLDSKKQTGNQSYPYLANFNIQWFQINVKRLNSMDFSEDDQSEFSLQERDLLVCEGGEVGRCAIWKNQSIRCFFQKALHRIRCNLTLCTPEYLQYVFFFRAKKINLVILLVLLQSHISREFN